MAITTDMSPLTTVTIIATRLGRLPLVCWAHMARSIQLVDILVQQGGQLVQERMKLGVAYHSLTCTSNYFVLQDFRRTLPGSAASRPCYRHTLGYPEKGGR